MKIDHLILGQGKCEMRDWLLEGLDLQIFRIWKNLYNRDVLEKYWGIWSGNK